MNVVVVIPWREQASRRYAHMIVESWYREVFPEWTILNVDTDDDPFNLAACRNTGVMRADMDMDADVVILNDADTIPEPLSLMAAVDECMWDGLVHLPYDEYRSLGIQGTGEYLRDVPLPQCSHLVVDGAVSGVYVTTPGTWWKHGGQDDEFRGWGFEDAAWWMAHTTLLGSEPVRHGGRVYALHHESAVKEGPQYTANAARCYHYQQAQGNVEEMRKLVFNEPS